MTYVVKVGSNYYVGYRPPDMKIMGGELVGCWPGGLKDGPPQLLAEMRKAYYA